MSEPDRLRMAGPAARALSEALPEKVAAAVCDFINGALLDDPHRMGEPLDPPQATAIQHRADAGDQARRPGRAHDREESINAWRVGPRWVIPLGHTRC